MRTARTKKERFLPYAYDRFGLDFSIRGLVLDGSRAVERVDGERRLVALEEPWSEAVIDLSVEVRASLLQHVLPERERAAAPAHLLVAVRCPDTRLRRGERIASAPLSPGVFNHRLTLSRADLSGTVELLAYLVRSAPSPARVPGQASARGARLASARGWELRVDRKRTPEGTYLDVRFRSFSRDEALPPAERGNLYRLECDQPAPTLWLNEDHQAVKSILMNNGSAGRHARLREVFFDAISHPVWTQLFLRAARDVIVSGEPVYDWEEGVLAMLTADMYPEIRTEEERLDRLRHEYEDLSLVLGRLDGALQRRNEVWTHMSKLIEEVIG